MTKNSSIPSALTASVLQIPMYFGQYSCLVLGMLEAASAEPDLQQVGLAGVGFSLFAALGYALGHLPYRVEVRDDHIPESPAGSRLTAETLTDRILD